jgi:hypothetical protein
MKETSLQLKKKKKKTHIAASQRMPSATAFRFCTWPSPSMPFMVFHGPAQRRRTSSSLSQKLLSRLPWLRVLHCRSTALSRRSMLPAGIHSGLLLTVTVQIAPRIRADLCCSQPQIFHLTTVNTKLSFLVLRR